ncbi:MAG: PVC-type heme-binding CxxCH protein [Planctomycetota bacterium]
MLRKTLAVCLVFWASASQVALAADLPDLKVLFLGDRGHHKPEARAKQLIPVLAARGIHIDYTERVSDLNSKTLSKYDSLIVYANSDVLSPEQEKALLDFVAGGKGFVPLHCASFCFRNSDAYVQLVGAQFQRHGFEKFRTQISKPDHPLMQDLFEFETWDETYVHSKHNEHNRTVLQTRREGSGQEPWTWTRTHGKGRVFYTAYGHDHRTWANPGFHALVERGIRWSTGDDRVLRNNGLPHKGLKPFQYGKAIDKIPNYIASRSWGTQGDVITQMQLPAEPKESQKHLVLPPGFRAELFASEPDIVKPIAMNWDEKGRLWVAETIDYPNDLQPEDRGNDRLKICEDRDGDGQADRFTIFADKLSIPTSLTFAMGGVIVHQAPHTLFLKDNDGDDRADERRKLFSGWSTGDTHAGPSNLQYGFDNWIWGMVGYSGYRGKIGGEDHNFRMGFYRFRPDGSKMEFIRNTNNNSWGVSFTEEGILFGSTANNNPSVYMPIANRYYDAVKGWSSRGLGATAIGPEFYPITDRVRQVDQHGRFTAAAGHAIYTARAYPKHYWNNTAFVTGPTGHLVATFLLESVGGDYVTRNSWNLMASDDEWTAPIIAEVGPDGQVWVADWYNYIVQHNPTPRGFRNGKGNAYVTTLRDKTHGRIYRVVHEDAPKYEPVNLAGASAETLVSTLSHDNLFWRRNAQRLLVERGKKDVVPALVALSSDPKVDTAGIAAGPTHALWTLHGSRTSASISAPSKARKGSRRS